MLNHTVDKVAQPFNLALNTSKVFLKSQNGF